MKTERPYLPILMGLTILSLLAAAVVISRRSQAPARGVEQPRAESPAAVVSSVPASPTSHAPVATTNSGFELRPFAVAKESAAHQWTAEDAKDTNVIRRLAHNPLEYNRMLEENPRIIKRELVYRKETLPQLLQQLLPVGQQLQSFTLPGLDGLEVEVEVTKTRVNGMAQSGSVIGRIKGRLNSLVSVGFYNGCESYNVISPDENLYLIADAREPGEVIVKQIDPAIYTPPTSGKTPDFILPEQLAPGLARPQPLNK